MTIRMVLTYFLKTEQLTNVYEPSAPVISPHPIKAQPLCYQCMLLCASVSLFQRERLHWASPQEHLLPGTDSHSPACIGISELHSYSWISTGDVAPGHSFRRPYLQGPHSFSSKVWDLCGAYTGPCISLRSFPVTPATGHVP